MITINVVCGIIFNRNGNIFIARRKEGKHLAGYWEFPGGKVDTNETNKEALSRELREELNMKVKVFDLLGSNIHSYEGFRIRLIAYKCFYEKSTIRLSDHDEFTWIDKSEFINYSMAPADIPLIELIQ